MPPKPVIVSTKANDSSTKIFDYSIQVFGEVRNEGGDGYVVIEVNVEQNGKSWKKTQQLYIESYQTSKFSIDFDEVKLLDKTPQYSVICYALGRIRK